LFQGFWKNLKVFRIPSQNFHILCFIKEYFTEYSGKDCLNGQFLVRGA